MFLQTTDLLAPSPRPQARPEQPITLCGPLGSSIGMGWGARENLAMLRDAGFDVRPLDVADSILFGRDLPETEAEGFENAPEPGPGLLLVHANPPQLPFLFLHLGRRFVGRKYAIGYCVWELPRIPESWRHKLRFVQRIWCPSSFSAEAFRESTEKPVHVVPHAVEPDPGAQADRNRFAIPTKAFAVLTAIHLGSGMARKNPLGAIRAFKSAFGDSRDAFLLMKVSSGDVYPERLAQIELEIGNAPNIRLSAGPLSDRDYWSLLSSIDAVLSLHRSEGFGLVMAQAMALGKVAIATGWSGNMDYMTPENSYPVRYQLVPVEDPEENYREADQKWADPEIEHAATLLRRIASDGEARQRIGAAAAESIGAKFSRSAITNVLIARLEELGLEKAGKPVS